MLKYDPIFQGVWWHIHPFTFFLPPCNKAIRKITECLPKIKSWPCDCFSGHSSSQSFWYWKQGIVLVTIDWPSFILPLHNTMFLIPKKQVSPPSKRETEFGIPLFQPFCCPPIPLLPPLLDPELGRETPQLRDARLAVEVQVWCIQCVPAELSSLSHATFFQAM